MNIHLLGVALAATLFCACGNAPKPEEAKAPAAEPADSVETGTPVTVTGVDHGPIDDYIELNAVSAFLQKSYVKANANGYLQSSDVYPGKDVAKGLVLFTLKTKEAQSIGDAIERLDTSLRFSGINPIRANQNGYITQLNHQPGDYVQDGEQLAVISDRNSFVFLLNLPYELRREVLGRRQVELLLPDGTKLNGVVGSLMPTVDSISQTQNVVIRVPSAPAIPENLIAKVHIVRSAKTGVQSLPKSALLTDETENEFWVMKLLDSVTAVKVPVRKGIETRDRVEIVSPVFAPSDRVLVTGNYGLPDTAKVKIETGGGNP